MKRHMLNSTSSLSPSARTAGGTLLALVAGFMLAQEAEANPAGGAVTYGSATISQTATTTTIDQASNKAILNWNSFNIGNGETTTFNQPGASSVALNRIDGSAGASQILGNLNANGKVFLINPNGMLFGQNAQVNVGTLVATTANISDTNFINGNYVFDQPGNYAAAIENQGTINADVVALVAGTVKNSGTINATLGKVALGASDVFVLNLGGDGLIGFAVGAVPSAPTPGGEGVINTGTINADGGSVELLANSENLDFLSQAIKVDGGTVNANTVNGQKGKITVDGGPFGKVVLNNATLNAKGDANNDGGEVNVYGDKIYATGNTKVSTKGKNGGIINFGGNYQNITSKRLAHITSLGLNTVLDASSIDPAQGVGGAIGVFSGGTTEIYGSMYGKTIAMDAFGDEGELTFDPLNIGSRETDGHEVTIMAEDDTEVIIDPEFMTIGNGKAGANYINVETLKKILNAGSNVIAQAVKDLMIEAGFTWSGKGSFTGLAGRDIFANGMIRSMGKGNVTLAAGRNIHINAPIFAANGTIWANSLNGYVATGRNGSLGTDTGIIRVTYNGTDVINSTGQNTITMPRSVEDLISDTGAAVSLGRVMQEIGVEPNLTEPSDEEDKDTLTLAQAE